MRGAPKITPQTGTVIAAIDAFLLTGWGITTALSVTVLDGVATAQLQEGSYFDDLAIVLITGATTPAALNGEARVLSHTNNSIKFETDAPNGVAAGSITIKFAPQGGWEKTYIGTNKAVYRSTDPKWSGHYLRVDDSSTQAARVRGYEAMTDVDTGTGLYPTDVQISGGGYWYKSYNSSASTTAIPYTWAADSMMLLVAIAAGVSYLANYTGSPARGFGLPIVLSPAGDNWATLLSAQGNTAGSGNGGGLCGGGASSSIGMVAMARAFSGLGSCVYASQRPMTGTYQTTSGADAWLGAAPSKYDGQLKLSEVVLTDTSGDATPRVLVPGLRYIPQSGVMTFVKQGDIFKGADGRNFVAIEWCADYTSSVSGVYALDITGPWRSV